MYITYTYKSINKQLPALLQGPYLGFFLSVKARYPNIQYSKKSQNLKHLNFKKPKSWKPNLSQKNQFYDFAF